MNPLAILLLLGTVWGAAAFIVSPLGERIIRTIIRKGRQER